MIANVTAPIAYRNALNSLGMLPPRLFIRASAPPLADRSVSLLEELSTRTARRLATALPLTDLVTCEVSAGRLGLPEGLANAVGDGRYITNGAEEVKPSLVFYWLYFRYSCG